MTFTDEAYIRSTLVPRERDAHKGDFGKILIFAGSPGMAGAAVLCGRAALKSGAGLVQYLLPTFESPLLPVLQISVPEATCISAGPAYQYPANAAASGTSMKSGPDLAAYSAVACGSGLGKSMESLKILHKIIDGCTSVLVADADALNLIAENADLAEKFTASPAAKIITPHIGEAKRLLHTDDPISGPESRCEAVKALTETYRCIAVLKGAGTLVAAPQTGAAAGTGAETCTATADNGIFLNTTGNPGMATAGSGDSLAGIIASLAGQGYAPLDAARMGVFLHGKAGDLAAAELGEAGMTASDIVRYIPYAFKLYAPADRV